MISNNFREVAYKIKNIIQYQGPHYLIWQFLVYCLAPLGDLRMTSLYRIDLRNTLVKFPVKVAITAGEATDSDIEQVVRIMLKRPLNRKEQGELYLYRRAVMTILRNIRLGRLKCFIAKVDDKVVHYNWIYFKKAEAATETGALIRLKDSEAVLNYAYTLQAWRGKGIHTDVQAEMLRFLKRSGYQMAYTFAPKHNRSSTKTHERLNWERCGILLLFDSDRLGKTLIYKLAGFVSHPFLPCQFLSHRWKIKILSKSNG